MSYDVESADKLNECNDGKRSSEVLLKTLEELEKVKQENKKLKDILYNISYQTPALGGNKKDMERALLDIDYLCDLALRPEEIKELKDDSI